MPNIDGAMGHKIETRKHQRHEDSLLFNTQQTNPAQSLQENAITVYRPRLCNSLPKYLRDIESFNT